MVKVFESDRRNKSKMKIYKFPENYEKKSDLFKVSAGNNDIFVYGCDVSAYPFNRVWPGKQRDKIQTEKAAFVMIGSDDAVTLNIEASFDFSSVKVRPLSKNIKAENDGNKVNVTFDKPGQYSVEFDGMHKTLSVFVNPEKDFCVDTESENVIYFGEGIHIFDERIMLEDNTTLFIDEGAVLYGSVNAVDKNNIKVVGYGIIDNSRMVRANEINGCAVLAKDAPSNSGNPIFMERCENVVIEGVTIVDSSGWNIYLDGCRNITVDNIKLIGQWRYNADGCDFCNCTNGIIRNSYLRNFDDCITVKGFKRNNNLPVENILAENCVLWCDWGKALEVGAETCAPYMERITFRDCDIIHTNILMMDVQQGDGARISDVCFENIRLEYSGEEMIPQLQEDDSKEYTEIGKTHTPVPFAVTSGVTMWSIDDHTGDMKNVYFKDIKIFSDTDIIPTGAVIRADDSKSSMDSIFLENFTINGRKLGFDELGIQIGEGVGNVYFESEKVN